MVLVGAGGRMGKTLVRCLHTGTVPNLKLVGAVDLWDAPDHGKDIGLAAGVGELGIPLSTDLAAVAPKCDVVVDFSSHHGTAGNAVRMADWKKAWVIGTTGLSDHEKESIQKAAKEIPIMMAPNMSLGVNLLCVLLEQAGRALKGQGYDVEIVERHHRHKKDSPSGTALGLGEAVAKGLNVDLKKVSVNGRSGMAAQERSADEIGFHAVRGGDFIGDHTVIFAADGESIELSHRATSRDTFAIGALRAAAWLAGKKPGLYSMRDVLGLSSI